MEDFTNYTQLDAALVIEACVECIKDQKDAREKEYTRRINEFRQVKGFPWNRRPETDEEVVTRFNSRINGFWDLRVYKRKSDYELAAERLKQLAECAVSSSGVGTVLVNQMDAIVIHPYLTQQKQLLTE